ILFFFGTRKNGVITFKNKMQRNIQQKMRGGSYAGNGTGAGGNTQRAKVDRTTFAGPGGQMAVHRCAVCGRTELDAPDLEFRFCSKCNGNYEYCSDHLQNHIHVQ
ncbi:MAG: hypothetical protein J5973_08555, partial [Eubacterium sp.]|nr:hypothetical protein [Eubacterium sp.]